MLKHILPPFSIFVIFLFVSFHFTSIEVQFLMIAYLVLVERRLRGAYGARAALFFSRGGGWGAGPALVRSSCRCLVGLTLGQCSTFAIFYDYGAVGVLLMAAGGHVLPLSVLSVREG